jgi:hypothetical protein
MVCTSHSKNIASSAYLSIYFISSAYSGFKRGITFDPKMCEKVISYAREREEKNSRKEPEGLR